MSRLTVYWDIWDASLDVSGHSWNFLVSGFGLFPGLGIFRCEVIPVLEGLARSLNIEDACIGCRVSGSARQNTSSRICHLRL